MQCRASTTVFWRALKWQFVQWTRHNTRYISGTQWSASGSQDTQGSSRQYSSFGRIAEDCFRMREDATQAFPTFNRHSNFL